MSLLEDRFGLTSETPLSLEQAAHKYGLRREEVRVRESRALFQLSCMRDLIVALGFHRMLAEGEDKDDPRDMYPSLYAEGA